MKKRIRLLCLLLMLITGFTSYGRVYIDTTTVLLTPDKMPEYKKGMRGWLDFLEGRLERDLPQKQGAPAGRYLVIASFLVDSVGGVRDIKIEFDRGYGTGRK